jgi:hypothetical protein
MHLSPIACTRLVHWNIKTSFFFQMSSTDNVSWYCTHTIHRRQSLTRKHLTCVCTTSLSIWIYAFFFQRKINFSHVHEISCWWRAIGRRKTINKFKNWLYWYCWITLVCLDRCLKVKESDYSVPIIFHNDCCLHKLNIFKSFACSRNVMHKCSWTATPLFAACLYIYYLILLSHM